MYNSFWESLPQLTAPESGVIAGRTPTLPGHRPPTRAESRRTDEAASVKLTIDQAQAEATRIIRDANVEADRLYLEAKEAGFARGAEAARTEVTERLEAEYTQRIEDLRADLNSVLEIVESERVAMWNNSDKEILAFAMDVAKKILRTEVQQNKGAVLEVIRHALRRVVDKEQIRIRINPGELEHVRSQREELLLLLDGARNLEIVDDRRIDPGGCVIETTAGTIDAKIDTQFEQIVRALEIEQ